MKVRFDGLDVTAMVAYVQRTLTGRRVVNVYDGTSSSSGSANEANTSGSGSGSGGSVYVLKLDAVGNDNSHTNKNTTTTNNNNNNPVEDGNNASKSFLLLESGIRFHPLSHFTSESPMPSPFCAKLRKHLRGLRLEQVQQIHTDRVVLLQFGVGPSRHYVILELYAKGNVILTNGEYRILAVLRSHVYFNNDGVSEGNDRTNHKRNNHDDDDTLREGKQGGGNTITNNINTTTREKVAVQVNHIYPVSYATASSTLSLCNTQENDNDGQGILGSFETRRTWLDEQFQSSSSTSTTSNTTTINATSTKKKKSGVLTLKTLLLKPSSGVSQLGPALLEHCILMAGLAPHEPLLHINHTNNHKQPPLSEEQWNTLRKTLQTEGPRILQGLQEAALTDTPGYILYQPREQPNQESKDAHFSNKQRTNNNDDDDDDKNDHGNNTSDLPHADKILQDFLPHLLKQHESLPRIEYSTFAAAVTDFYIHLVTQKRHLKALAAERAAHDKLERVRRDQQERLLALERDQGLLEQQARAVQAHAQIVDQALLVINSALGSGMDWHQLETLIQVEQQQNQNPVAMIIHKLELEHDAMILRLPVGPGITTRITAIGESESSSAGKQDAGTDSTPASLEKLDVRISLKDSAFANANALFAKYRASKEKAAKTIEASTKALKAAEDSAKRQLLEAQTKNKLVLAPAVHRKPAWFEKFLWFITSDNYLVLGGCDAHQNELLVKRYLRAGDAYLHADVHGAASCVLRAKRRRRKDGKTEPLPLSEQALREAGNFTICRSSAWTSKMVTSAWWVEAHQVSKTAPTGEYLTVGSFMIRGKKNFLPPSQLEMGLAVLFRLGDDDSIARHKNDRRDFALMALEEDETVEDVNAAVKRGKNDRDSTHEGEDMIEDQGELPEVALSYPGNNGSVTSGVVESESPGSDTPAEQISDQSSVHDGQGDASDGGENDGDSIVDNEAVDGLLDDGNSSDKDLTCDHSVEDANDSGGKRRGLSVRERKLIKKYGSIEAAEDILGGSIGKTENAQRKAASSTSEGKNQSQGGATTRGKKAKLRKAKKKYGDQDDEDRKLAMLALQGGEKAKRKTGRGKENLTMSQKKVAAETAALLLKDSSKVASQLPEKVQSILADCVMVAPNDSNNQNNSLPEVRWDKFDASTLEQLMTLDSMEAQLAAANRLRDLKKTVRIDNFSASLGGIIRAIKKHGHTSIDTAIKNQNSPDKSKRKTRGEKKEELAKWKDSLADEGIDDADMDDDAIDDTLELSKLTAKPVAEDLILFAVPVCAPYHTLSQYSYRVKLTPGNMKRGKAAKQCLDILTKSDTAKTSPAAARQIDLIKKVNENDWVKVICADVKISAAGASKAVKKQKMSSKKGKK